MAGRLGHIDDARRVGHVPKNGIRPTNYAYGYSNVIHDFDPKFGLNTATDLAAISYWYDKVNNHKAVQATAGNQPRLILSEVNFNNNLN